MTSHSSLLDQLKNRDPNEKVQGDTVIVTLNPALQQACWYALGDSRGAIIVMEPDSGKILAMVSKPDFDPNFIELNWDDIVNDSYNSVLLNRASQGLYPPGSTFKILTTLAYLREHPDDYQYFTFNCSGVLTEGNSSITCYNANAHGMEDLRTAFAKSCNSAFASIGISLDNQAFRRVAEAMRFNNTLPTDILHSESSFRLTANSSIAEQMETAIGQGQTLVTPLHMALITSTVANGGVMMKPYYVAGVETCDGATVSQTKPEIYGEVMTADEAGILTSFMEETVQSGTAVSLSWNYYTVAGKTGSAEYESYGVLGTHSWFTGFSNVDDPDIVVTVLVEDGGSGSQSAVPIAQSVFDAYYYYS